jgi:tetratricopeptide (TPR) repeat protein
MSDLPSARPANPSLLGFSLSLLPAHEQELLRYLAPLTSFDEEIVSDVAPRGEPGDRTTLASLAGYPFVLKVRDRPGRYRIRDDMRRVLLDSWWDGQPSGAVPPDLAALCKRLAGRLQRRPDTDPAEVVGLRLFAAPQDALAQWEDLYAAADKRFDLVRCRFLIGMLSWMAAVDPEVDAAREEYQAYVEARSLWTDDWYQTGTFLLPEASGRAFESLLRDDKNRVLELQGSGGFGKTMHIRWLIARRCVPADAHIPCARIDFDAVDPIAATREPYLVLLAMADQLDRQMPGDTFGKLVRTYSADLVRLYRRVPAATIPTREMRDSPGEQARASAADKVLRSFAGRLAEISDDEPPVVLILDTLEVPLHLPDTPRGPAAKPLLTALAEVQKAPAVRLVLSGRYEIPEEIRKLFPDAREPFVLPKFSPGEARAYLTGKRHVARDDLVDATVQAADGTPFSLALLADLIEEDPAISPGTIAEYRGAEYAYLIERVVKRISEQPVRWVLRYAAVPRRFDYDFVRDVLWPRVREEMSGKGGLDRPARDDIPHEHGEDDLWAVGELPPDDEQAVRQVWDQVRRYASGSSWISPDDADPDALRLQAEVVRPLRELLSENEIFWVLHRDAAEYFLARAAAEAARRDGAPGEIPRDRQAEYLREAVFHRFQFEGDAASRWWEEQVHAADGPVARRALTRELSRGREFADREGRPVPWARGGTLVSEHTLQQARLEFCIASAELATIRALLWPQDPLWQDASDALERLQRGPADTLPAGRVALARAAVTLGARRLGDVLDDLGVALESEDVSPRERLWLAVLNAGRLTAAGSAGVDVSLQRATELEHYALEERDVRGVLATFVAQRLRQRGLFDEAITVYVAAVEEGLGNDENFRLLESATRSSVGDTETARSVAAKITASGSALSPLAQVYEARCLRRQQAFGPSLAVARGALAAVEATRDATPLSTLVRGTALLEIGRIEASLLRIVSARAAFADALRAFGDAGDAESTASCYLQEALLVLDGLGNLKATGVALDYADRVAPGGGDVALLAQLTRAELAHCLGDETGAAAILDGVWPTDEGAALPTRVAVTALIGIAVGRPRDRDRYVEQLAKSLGQITPPIARLPFLTRAIRCQPLMPQSKGAKQLRAAVIPPHGWDAELDSLAPSDRPTLRLRAAALARLLGDRDEAGELLQAAWRETRDKEEPLVGLLEILRLARQLGLADLISEAGPTATASARSQAREFPLLAAVTVVEYLEAARETRAELPEDPATACSQAEQWLDQGGLSAEAWRARLAKLFADTSAPDEATAMSYRQAAVQLYTAAGNVQAAEEVQSRITGPGGRGGPSWPGLTVDLSLSKRTVDRKVAGGRFRLLPRIQTVYPGSLQDLIPTWLQAAGTEPYPPELPDAIVGQWPEFKSALAELIDVTELARRLPRSPEQPDLAVRIKDGALQPLPWELAVSKKHDDRPLFEEFRRAYRQSAHAAPDTRLVRVVQAGLNLFGSSLQVDGVSGPDTANALRALESNQDPASIRAEDPVTVQRLHKALLEGARPGAVIVQPAPSEGPQFGSLVERRYDQAGFGACTVSQAHVPSLIVLLLASPPPVIVHVVGGLVATAGMTAVDLQASAPGWGSPDQAGLLTAADLDLALRAVSRDWPAPVVVLDVPAPSGLREIADQMLLRNSFAGDLFALGAARAVVATGLAGRKSGDLARSVLLEGLAHGDAIGDVIQRMRRQAPSSGFGRFDKSAAFAATALWTNDPSMRLPAPGRT